jgi:hypothetical protein
MSGQTIPSKFISLVPTNGNQFSGTAGQKVIFELEPSLGFVKGRDSYLVLKVLNNDTSERQRVGFNNLAGVDSIINRVDIYSLKTGQHLETLQNYNQWSSIENQYFYDDKTNIQSLSGVGSECFANDVTDQAGNVQPTAPLASSVVDSVLSPILGKKAAAADQGKAVYNYRTFTTPLKAGIFRWWDDERLTPILQLLGLRIEITLESAANALLHLEAVDAAKNTYSLFNPPNFVVGDATTYGGIPIDVANNGDTTIKSTVVFDDAVKDCGFSVGNVISLREGGGNQYAVRTISKIEELTAGDAGKVQITFTGGVIGGGPHTAGRVTLVNDTRAYKVEPEFRVLSVQPPVNIQQGIDYEFTSYDLYFDTLFASQRKHQIDIPTVQTRALAIMTQFENPENVGRKDFSSTFTGENPSQMNMDSVQYFIKGRLQPVRAYDPRTKKEKIIAEHELVKALTTINKEPQDLGQSDAKNLNNYTNTFVIARELARGQYFYDLSDAEPQIRLGFSGARTANLTCNTYVWSKKIVVADPQQGIRVML